VQHTYVVANKPTPILLNEDWHQPITPRWQPFGSPSPRIFQDSLIGPAFWNNGDGTYFSGAYRRDTPMDGHQGLALDAVLRLRITKERWQYVAVGFAGLRDVAHLRQSWDHVTGYLPAQFFTSSCMLAYPAGEGPTAALRLSGAGNDNDLPRARGARLPSIALGVPTKVRIQVLPDGRCGIAVNGVAIGTSPPSGNVDSLYLFTEGSSVDTRVLVGGMTVRRGVPTDVDWNRVPR